MLLQALQQRLGEGPLTRPLVALNHAVDGEPVVPGGNDPGKRGWIPQALAADHLITGEGQGQSALSTVPAIPGQFAATFPAEPEAGHRIKAGYTTSFAVNL